MSGRLDLFGDVVDAAALIESAAHAGQVLVTDRAWEGIDLMLDHQSFAVVEVEHNYRFKGIESKSGLRQILPTELAAKRSFPVNVVLNVFKWFLLIEKNPHNNSHFCFLQASWWCGTSTYERRSAATTCYCA